VMLRDVVRVPPRGERSDHCQDKFGAGAGHRHQRPPGRGRSPRRPTAAKRFGEAARSRVGPKRRFALGRCDAM